ncbi:MAG: hypothetical protein KBC11_00315 [Candidatus Pacebacteria bacterium]|nr:hypothetical protein [Candidatus Paceibacterota bacterium]
MFKTLQSFSPQRVFLVQGNIETFNTLVEDTLVQISELESQSLSRFTMEDAQRVVEFNLERKSGSWCIVYFDVFVPEAAQVLLKTLEEPRENIYIIFVTPRPYLIPQTIRSRVRLIPNIISNKEPKYLSSKQSLLEYVKETFGDDSVDASVRRAKATTLFDSLEHYVQKDSEKLKVVYEAKDMLFKANMPTKQVVEFLVTMLY